MQISHRHSEAFCTFLNCPSLRVPLEALSHNYSSISFGLEKERKGYLLLILMSNKLGHHQGHSDSSLLHSKRKWWLVFPLCIAGWTLCQNPSKILLTRDSYGLCYSCIHLQSKPNPWTEQEVSSLWPRHLLS